MRTNAFRITLHLLVWPLVYLLPFLVTYGKISKEALFDEPGGVIHAVSTALLIGYAYLNHYLLVPTFYLHRKYFAYALFVIACLMVVMWFPHVFGVFEHRDHFPPAGPEHPPFKPGEGPPPRVSKLGYNLVLFIVCTFASINIRQQRQLLEVQKEKVNAELSFLKAQINPHFLFNTLNSIYALSILKSDDTPKAITQLSELMRYILKDSNADTVPLDKELAYISNYVALQKRRLGNTVQIDYSAPTVFTNRRVAPLILTSFVENAFKHGVNPDQDSVIHIGITYEGDQLQLVVMNNKVTSTGREETMGIGLKNATSRLEHLYAGKHKLTIEDGAETFAVHLTLTLND